MLDQAFERLPGEIEAVEARIFLFQLGDHAQRLGVVVEAAGAAHRGVERALAGMTERRMAEIVGERQRLGEVLVDAKRPRNGAGDLRDFETMGEARAVMIALVIDEHLGLVVEPPEGHRMQDAVAVARVRRARGARRLGHEPAAARLADRRHKAQRGAAGRHALSPGFAGKIASAWRFWSIDKRLCHPMFQ